MATPAASWTPQRPAVSSNGNPASTWTSAATYPWSNRTATLSRQQQYMLKLLITFETPFVLHGENAGNRRPAGGPRRPLHVRRRAAHGHVVNKHFFKKKCIQTKRINL